MAIITQVAPYATIPAGGWQLGAGPDFYTAISDGSDATYDIDNLATSGTRYLYAFMPAYTIPAFAMVKSARPVTRSSQASGGSGLGVLCSVNEHDGAVSARTVAWPDIYIRDFTGAALPGPIDQRQMSLGIYVRIDTGTYIGVDDHRLYQVSLQLDVNYAPVVSAVALNPVDAYNRTSAPALTWTYTDAENDPQVGYQVAYWKTSDTTDANWVDPATSYTPAAGGPVRTPVLLFTGAGQNANYSPPSSLNLTNGTAYTVYVRAADAPLGARRYGAWASYAFTQAVLAPPTPAGADITAVWDATHWRTTFTFQHRLNLLTTNQASLETNTTGWSGQANTTIARDTAQFLSGLASLKATAVALGVAGPVTLIGTAGIPVVGNQTYTGMAWSRANTTARVITAALNWYNAAGTFLSSSAGTGVTNASGSWTQSLVTDVAPASAAFAALKVSSDSSTAAGEIHRYDQAGIFPGAGAVPGWTRGGLAAAATLLVERTADSLTWVPIPLVPAMPTGGSLLTTYDTANPPNTAVTYRLSTVSVDELGYSVRSTASAATGSITGLFAGFVLRDTSNPLGEVAVAPQGSVQVTQDARQGRFWPLGAELPITVSDTVGGRRTHLRLLVRGRPALDALVALRRRETTLLLQFDTTEAWWCHLGESGQMEHVLNAQRNSPVSGTAASYFVDYDVDEVVAPAGLPQGLT